MALKGAEILLYPTVIGSEPQSPRCDGQPHWEIVMRGHAGAIILPVVVSNRIGTKVQDGRAVTVRGSFFIADATGQLLAKARRDDECVLSAKTNLAAAAELRRAWGLFRDRGPDLYSGLQSL